MPHFGAVLTRVEELLGDDLDHDVVRVGVRAEVERRLGRAVGLGPANDVATSGSRPGGARVAQ